MKTELKGIMCLAWQFVKRNGLDMSTALKIAWANFKLKAKMKLGIVRFYFQKVDGTKREAYGTLSDRVIPNVKESGRKSNETVQTYFDTERMEWRSYKMANLITA